MTAPPAPSSDALNEAIRLFNHEKTLDAYRLLKQHKVESVSELNVDEQSKKDLHQILEDGKFAEFLLNEFESGNGWHQCVNKDKMQSFYKDKGSGLHAVKVQGSIEAPIFQVLSIFYEVDLYASWVPSMKESTVIHKFDKYRFLSYFSFSLPWPFSPRDLVSYAFAIDQLESDGSIIIVVKGVTSESQYKDIIVPYENTGSVFVGCEYSGVRIKYISPEETYVEIIGSVDPKLSLVPYWLINMITDQVSYLSVSKLRSVSSQVPQSEYQKRIDTNEVYREIKSKIAHLQ